jgi:uncharacterized phiE125 gp8 family phage protein
MPLILTEGPASEPISLEEAKAHCRIDADTEDALVSSLILAARMHVEQSLGLALIRQCWSLYLDRWPDAASVELPLAPLIAVDAVRLYSSSGTWVTLDPGLFCTDTVSRRPRLGRAAAQAWPVPGRELNGIEIALTAGYGASADDVPPPLRQAIKLLVAHWYEAREPVTFGDDTELVPLTVASLISPYREMRL